MSEAIVPIVISVAATAYSAYSQYASGQEEKRGRKRREKQLRTRYGLEAQAAEKRHRAILAAQRARYGASGLTMEGTPLLVQMESLKESEEELARIRMFGEEAAGEERLLGKLAERSGYVRAGGEVISGVGSLLGTVRTGKYYEWW